MKPRQYIVRVRSKMYNELKKMQKEIKKETGKHCPMDKASSLLCSRRMKK